MYVGTPCYGDPYLTVSDDGSIVADGQLATTQLIGRATGDDLAVPGGSTCYRASTIRAITGDHAEAWRGATATIVLQTATLSSWLRGSDSM
jgi:hypothetical protein